MAVNQNDPHRQCHGRRSLENLSCTFSDVICFESVSSNDGLLERNDSGPSSTITERCARSRASSETVGEVLGTQKFSEGNISVPRNDLSTAHNRKLLSVDNGSQTDKSFEQSAHTSVVELSNEVYRCVKSIINDMHIGQCEPMNDEINNINSNARPARGGRERTGRGRGYARRGFDNKHTTSKGHSAMLASFPSLKPVKAVSSRSHSRVVVTYQPIVSEGENGYQTQNLSNNRPAVSCYDSLPPPEQVLVRQPATTTSKDAVNKEIQVAYTFPDIERKYMFPGEEERIKRHNSPSLEQEHRNVNTSKTSTPNHSTPDFSRKTFSGRKSPNKPLDNRRNRSYSPNANGNYTVRSSRSRSPCTLQHNARSVSQCDKATSVSRTRQDISHKQNIPRPLSPDYNSFERRHWHSDRQDREFHHRQRHRNPDDKQDDNIESTDNSKDTFCSIM